DCAFAWRRASRIRNAARSKDRAALRLRCFRRFSVFGDGTPGDPGIAGAFAGKPLFPAGNQPLPGFQVSRGPARITRFAESDRKLAALERAPDRTVAGLVARERRPFGMAAKLSPGFCFHMVVALTLSDLRRRVLVSALYAMVVQRQLIDV